MWCETDLLFLFECGACNVGVCQHARTHTINVILTSYNVQGQYRTEYLPSRLRRSGRYSPVLPLYSISILHTHLPDTRRHGTFQRRTTVRAHCVCHVHYIVLYTTDSAVQATMYRSNLVIYGTRRCLRFSEVYVIVNMGLSHGKMYLKIIVSTR